MQRIPVQSPPLLGLAGRRPWRSGTALLVVVAILATVLTSTALGAEGTDVSTVAAAAPAWRVERLSTTPDGAAPDGPSSSPALSANGRHVAFVTAASDLGDAPMPAAASRVVVKDLVTGSTEHVSSTADGTPMVTPAGPDLSSDGSLVTMVHDSAQRGQAALHDRVASTTNDIGEFTPVRAPAMSDDGDRIAFVTVSDSLEDQRRHVWVHDTGATTGSDPSDVQVVLFESLYEVAGAPSLSGDGTRVAFDVTLGDDPTELRVLDITELTSAPPSVVTIAGGRLPALDRTGTVLVYALAGDRANDSIHVRDLTTGADRVVVDLAEGTTTTRLDLSDDGSTVAYRTVAGSTSELVVTSLEQGAEATVVAPVGAEDAFDLGADGRTVVFASSAGDLVGDDPAGTSDVFIARRVSTSAPTWPAGARLDAPSTGSSYVSLAWPAADDDLGVTGYRVFLDGTTVAQLDTSARTHTVSALQPSTAYDLAVVAVDADGVSSSPLALRVTTAEPAQDAGTAALTLQPGSGATMELSWDAAEGATAYVVSRATTDGEFVPVGQTANATTYTDSGLAAETAYRYRVDAVIAGQTVRHSVEQTATTAAVDVDSTTWTGRGIVDGQLSIEVRGASGWTGSVEVHHTSWYDEDGTLLDAPRAVVTTVPAPEDPATPGRYAARFTLTDGIAKITAIRGVLSDGANHSAHADATRLPLEVRGTIRVRLELPEGVQLSGRAVIEGVAQLPLTGWTAWDAPAVPSGTHTVRVLDEAGTRLASGEVTVTSGRRSVLTLSPRPAGAVLARVVDHTGAPVKGSTVSFVGLPDRETLGTGTTDRAGLVRAPGELAVGDRVELTVTPPAAADLEPTTQELEADASGAAVDVTLPSARLGTLRGRITLGGDVPAAGARVVMSQTVRGTARSFSAVADADGRYRIDGFVGTATVVVNHQQDPTRSLGTIELTTTPTDRDVSLEVAGTYRVQTTVSTRTVDDPQWRHLDIDELNGFHYRLSLRSGRTQLGVRSATTFLRAAPGDEVTFCGDGREFGMTSDCTTVTLGNSPVVPIELRMEGTAGVHAVVVDSAGKPLGSDLVVTASLARYVDGRPVQESFHVLNDATLDSPLPRPGRYRLVVSSHANGGSSYRSTRFVDFEVGEGEVVDLGNIAVSPSSFATASDVTVLRSVLPLHGTAEIRAAIRPDTAGTHSAMAARLELPAGTSLVDGSVTVDGEPVEATVTDEVAVVEIGERSFRSGHPEDAVVVRYRLATDGIEPGGGFNATVKVRSTHDGNETTQLAGGPTVRIAGVTLVGPEQTATHTVELTGIAPPQATVVVNDARQEVGRATAGRGGIWRLSVTLPDLGAGVEHVLAATASIPTQDGNDGSAGGEQLVASAPISVRVDPRLSELVGVTIVQRNGHTDGASVEIDPRQGMSRFPYVFRGDPGTIAIETQFAGRGEIETVQARVGTASGGATVELGGDRYRTEVATRNTDLGGIHVEYEQVPGMATVEDVAVLTEEQVRSLQPVELADAQLPTIEEDHDPSTNTRRVHVSEDASGYGAGASLTSTLSITSGLAHTPTADEQALARAAGVRVYGLTYSVTRTDTALTISGSALIPVDQLEPTSAAMASLSGFGVVRVSFQKAFEWGGAADGLIGDYGALDKYRRLDGLADWVGSNCNSTSQAGIAPMLEQLGNEALALDALKGVMQVAALVAAPGTFGIGTVAIWAVGFFLDKALDAALSAKMDQFEAFAKEACDDKNEDPFHDWPEDKRPDPNYEPVRAPDRPIAEPVWIHDPSGYVFDGVPSNRVVGAIATLTYGETAEGPFEVWDAEWYGQINPMVTDGTGAYGWDVPEGFWQVVYTKDGYETARSEVLEVLPPHFDVNVGLRPLAAPAVEGATASAGADSAVLVTFDTYMRLDTADRITVSSAEGAPLEGEVEPVDAEDGPAGRFARTFRFTPAAPFTGAQQLTLTVAAMATNHAGRPMLADHTVTLGAVLADAEAPTVTAATSPAPGTTGWHTSATTVELAAEDGTGSGVSEIRWSTSGAQAESGTAEGARAQVPVTAEGTTTVTYSAVDAAGNESEDGTAVVQLDAHAPVAAIASPSAGTRVSVGAVLTAGYSCADTGSGPATCVGRLTNGSTVANGARLPTGTVGTQRLDVTAVDVAGNTTTSTVTYEVIAPTPPPSATALLDQQISLVRSFKLPASRTIGLVTPLQVARLMLVLRSKPLACTAMVTFDRLVDTYVARRWLSAAQAAQLRQGSAAITAAVPCGSRR